jgi:hypothetical protein
MNAELLAELREIGKRTERSFSWLVQRCVTRSIEQVRELEAPDEQEREAAQ